MRLFLCCRTSVKFVTVGLKRGLFLQRVSSGEATWSPQSLSRGEARPEGKEEIIGVEAGGRIRDKRVTEITQSRNKKDTEHRSGRKHMRKRWQKKSKRDKARFGTEAPGKGDDGWWHLHRNGVCRDLGQVTSVFFYSWMLRQTEQESNEIIVLNLEISDYKYILIRIRKQTLFCVRISDKLL